LRERIAKLNSTAAIIECVHQPLYFEDVFTGERKGAGFARRQKSRVAERHRAAGKLRAKPRQARRRTGLFQALRRPSPVHQQEILNAINRSKKRQADIIITTQKDAVRFPKIDRRDLPFYFMRVEIKIVAGANDFQDCVRKICFR
jgi:tetraacyldisaccharide 4'-kinase